MFSARLNRRLIRHHLPLFLGSVALIGLLFALIQSEQVAFRLSMATAYAGMLLLVATLSIGPIDVLRSRPAPIGSNDIRRDIGIWAAVIGVVHVIVGLQVHLNSMLLYFFRQTGQGLVPRLDSFGFANYTGLVATLILALLLALSNDWSVRRLGVRQWKNLQRANYVGFALIAAHGVVYQALEKRTPLYIGIFGLMLMFVVAVQFRAFRSRRRVATSTARGQA